VSDHDFVFALDLSDPAQFDSMVAEVARAVFGHAGCAAGDVAEVTAALQSALAKGAAGGRRRCDVRFQAHAGELQVTLSFDGLSEWRTSRPLP
jgi:hypothetical protein